MEVFANILVPVFVGLFAVFAGLKYADFVSFRQQKAIMVLFIQEFTLLLRRAAMYYRQYLEGPVSFSTLFESSDSSTFIRLAEVTDNVKIIETALMLKSDFFQVLRYAERASEAVNMMLQAEASGDKELIEQAKKKARLAQQMALNHFMGEIFINKQFHRFKFEKYFGNINLLLDYLERVNTPSRLRGYLILAVPQLRRKKEDVELFVENRRKELSLLREKLEILREKEKKQLFSNEEGNASKLSEDGF